MAIKDEHLKRRGGGGGGREKVDGASHQGGETGGRRSTIERGRGRARIGTKATNLHT